MSLQNFLTHHKIHGTVESGGLLGLSDRFVMILLVVSGNDTGEINGNMNGNHKFYMPYIFAAGTNLWNSSWDAVLVLIYLVQGGGVRGFLFFPILLAFISTGWRINLKVPPQIKVSIQILYTRTKEISTGWDCESLDELWDNKRMYDASECLGVSLHCLTHQWSYLFCIISETKPEGLLYRAISSTKYLSLSSCKVDS